MERITIRSASADLPAFSDDMELTRLSALDHVAGRLSRFSLSDFTMRALDLQDADLKEGRINSVHTESTSMRQASALSLQFTRCNLGMLRWSGGKIQRTWFDSCKLLGARFDHVALEHVVFTDCKLDYSTLSQIRASGPVMFVRCSLREVHFEGCDLALGLFDKCDLVLTDFGPGRYRGCDLRGNDLSAVNGTHNLKSVIIDRDQLIQLAEAMAAELNMTFGDDLNV